MYGIFTYIWLIFMVNVGKYSIHGSYGIYIWMLQALSLKTCTEFPWICELTGFSRPPLFLKDTRIQNLNMAVELFHGFKSKKGNIFCILHCISYYYISPNFSRASFLNHMFEGYILFSYAYNTIWDHCDPWVLPWSKVVPYGSKRRSSCFAPKFRWLFCWRDFEAKQPWFRDWEIEN